MLYGWQLQRGPTTTPFATPVIILSACVTTPSSPVPRPLMHCDTVVHKRAQVPCMGMGGERPYNSSRRHRQHSTTTQRLSHEASWLAVATGRQAASSWIRC